MSVMGATNQLWVPGLPAKYFVRDIREIRFTNEEVPRVIGPFVDDGHDYTNRPDVAAKAEYVGRVGEPSESFPAGRATPTSAQSSPWSSRSITASIGRASIWATPRPTAGCPDRASPGRPRPPGAYQMKVRSVNEDGDASPIAAVHTFEKVLGDASCVDLC